jgi:hypothetical protein
MTQIVHAGRTETDVVVAFDIRWEGDLSGGRSVTWSMTVTSPDGRDSVRLAYQLVDGQFAAQFVLDRASGRRHDLAQDVDLDADEITVRFPTASVGVAASWPSWRAVITVDGEDVAERLLTLG